MLMMTYWERKAGQPPAAGVIAPIELGLQRDIGSTENLVLEESPEGGIGLLGVPNQQLEAGWPVVHALVVELGQWSWDSALECQVLALILHGRHLSRGRTH